MNFVQLIDAFVVVCVYSVFLDGGIMRVGLAWRHGGLASACDAGIPSCSTGLSPTSSPASTGAPLKAAEATLVGELHGMSGSWLWPAPYLAVARIWRVNQWMQSLSLLLCLSNKQIS